MFLNRVFFLNFIVPLPSMLVLANSSGIHARYVPNQRNASNIKESLFPMKKTIITF